MNPGLFLKMLYIGYSQVNLEKENYYMNDLFSDKKKFFNDKIIRVLK
jgi:hypothetical protein